MKLLLISALVSAIISMSAVKAEDAINVQPKEKMDGDDRKPSMFEVNGEWLALPEVFSNLDFNAPNQPAADDGLNDLLYCFIYTYLF